MRKLTALAFLQPVPQLTQMDNILFIKRAFRKTVYKMIKLFRKTIPRVYQHFTNIKHLT